MTDPLKIRPIENTKEDIDTLLRFCIDLAKNDGIEITFGTEKLKKMLFDPKSNIQACFLIKDNTPIGFTLFHECSTIYWAERGLYMNALYIEEQHRGKRYGKALIHYLKRHAKDMECHFVSWLMEEHNHKAREFYTKIGAKEHKGWSYMRLPLE